MVGGAEAAELPDGTGDLRARVAAQRAYLVGRRRVLAQPAGGEAARAEREEAAASGSSSMP